MKIALTLVVIGCSLFLIGSGLYNHESIGYVAGWITALTASLKNLGYELTQQS